MVQQQTQVPGIGEQRQQKPAEAECLHQQLCHHLNNHCRAALTSRAASAVSLPEWSCSTCSMLSGMGISSKTCQLQSR